MLWALTIERAQLKARPIDTLLTVMAMLDNYRKWD